MLKKLLFCCILIFTFNANASQIVASQTIAGATCDMYGNEYSSERLCDQGTKKNKQFSDCFGDTIHSCYKNAKTYDNADSCIRNKVRDCCYSVGGTFH